MYCIDSYCYGQECWGPVVLSFANEIPDGLLIQCANLAHNQAISLMMVFGSHSDLDVKGLHYLRPKLRGKVGIIVQNNT